MSEEIQDGEDLPEEVVEVEVPQEPDPAAIEEARKYGWRPKEEFDRNPEGWVDADRFLELPSTEVKRLRDERKASEQATEARMARLEAANKDAMQRALEQQRERHERSVAEIVEKQRAAVEIGDVEKWESLEHTKAKLRPPPEVDHSASQAVVDEYKSRNEWTKDPLLWRMAIDAVNTNPNLPRMSAAEQLDYAETRMKDYFPHKFAAPAVADKPKQRVDSGGLGGAIRSKGGVSSLPPEAMEAGKGFVAQNIYKNLEEYATAYWRMNDEPY